MHQDQGRGDSGSERLATGLGWFSVALGLAELTAPRQLSRLIGVPDTPHSTSVLRAMGLRELGNGLAILSQPGNPAWMWSRVGGDLVDLGALQRAASSDRSDPARVKGAVATVMGVTALDVLCAQQLGRNGKGAEAPARVCLSRSVTVNRPVEQVYGFWRDFSNLPRFMRYLESVTDSGNGRSRWRSRGPAGLVVEWTSQLVEDRAGACIRWHTVEGSDVGHNGAVRFRPAPRGRGTEVTFEIDLEPPAGPIGRGLAWLVGRSPEQQIAEDLQRFKQLVETGEIPLSEGPGLWRAAQPADDPARIRELAGVSA